MINSTQEFTDKLSKYFDGKINVELEDGIKTWLRKKKLNGVELEALYELVCEHADRIPKVNMLAKIWREHGQRSESTGECSYANNARERCRDKGWEYIIREIARLRNEQDSRELKASEIDLIHDFTDLSTIHDMLQQVPDLVMPADKKGTYLRKVREDIIAGFPVNIRAARIKIDERIKQYKEIYGDEELEQHEKTSQSSGASYSDLVNVFSDRKQMLDPEPDRRSA